MNATLSRNGLPRKQLSDQLDRLDRILDLLGDGLTEAVSDAVRAGTAIVIKETLIELLTDPTVLAAIRSRPSTTIPAEGPAGPVQKEQRPSMWSRIKARAVAVRKSVVTGVKRLIGKTVDFVRSIPERINTVVTETKRRLENGRQFVLSLLHVLGVVRHFRKMMTVSAGLGTASGVASYQVPHELTALFCGVMMAVTVLGLQIIFRGARSMMSMA